MYYFPTYVATNEPPFTLPTRVSFITSRPSSLLSLPPERPLGSVSRRSPHPTLWCGAPSTAAASLRQTQRVPARARREGESRGGIDGHALLEREEQFTHALRTTRNPLCKHSSSSNNNNKNNTPTPQQRIPYVNTAATTTTTTTTPPHRTIPQHTALTTPPALPTPLSLSLLSLTLTPRLSHRTLTPRA